MKKIFALLTAVTASACGSSSSDDGVSYEMDEERSAGAETIEDEKSTAYSHPLPSLAVDPERAFFRGRALFRDAWVSAPGSAVSRDGLGPVFNARTCEACHVKDGRGRPPESPTDSMTTMLVRLSVPGANGELGPDATYGDQIQPFAVDGVVAEGSASVRYEAKPGEYGDGEAFELQAPVYDLSTLARGPVGAGVLTSPRVAPVMIGLGLLEAVPEATIVALADENDADGDGISGRVNRVTDKASGGTALGRFGWKANQPSLRQQAAGAFLGDIGMSSLWFPTQACASAQADCLAAATGGEPELEEVILDDVAFYSGTLSVPARRKVRDTEVLRGRKLFADFGCEGCHTRKLQIATHATLPVIDGDTIQPYTDLLLHDMGDALADGRPDGLATGNEWRTPPLWGIGLLEKVNGHLRLLHDGRARGFAEAVLWHGGEGEKAKEKFRTASREERQALVKFLESL